MPGPVSDSYDPEFGAGPEPKTIEAAFERLVALAYRGSPARQIRELKICFVSGVWWMLQQNLAACELTETAAVLRHQFLHDEADRLVRDLMGAGHAERA